MHLGDSVFILILALVMLGPKKTSELAGQLGKLMAEFRKASNDFKYQFNEEMRVSEQQEQQRKLEAERAGLESGAATGAVMAPALGTGENSILPPAVTTTGEAVPYAVSAPDADESAIVSESEPVSAISATTGEEQSVEDHPLLQVREIPPMPVAAVADPVAAPAPVPEANGHHGSAELAEPMREQDGAPVRHG